MPPRTIKDHFKKIVLNPDVRPKDPPKNDCDAAVTAEPVSSSPLSEPPSSLHSPPASSTSTETGPNLQLRETLQTAINGFTTPLDPESVERDSTKLGGSFFRDSISSSQRVIKHGREIVISSDGDDTDSSLESAEDLLKKFMNSGGTTEKKVEAAAEEPILHPRKRLGLNSTDRSNIPYTLSPKYKFSLDSLVTDAVDDDETEAGVARAKSAFEKRSSLSTGTPTGASDGGRNRELREDVLASAISDGGDDGNCLQRVLDAVRRTEALEQENSWSFFQEQINTPLPPEFPRDSIPPAGREAFLRDCAPRERAFQSGIIEAALVRNLLPDEVIVWIFNSVPTELRDDLRYAYCRALKLCSPKRIAFLIRPTDIDTLFRSLGATKMALSLTERVVPDSSQLSNNENQPRDWRCLVSILDLLRGAAEYFADDTREHILHILFRLALDKSLTKHDTVCSVLERAITASLQSIPEEKSESMIYNICITAYNTIDDVLLQSQLLNHILPSSSWIALFRCRLATAFLLQDISPLTELPDVLLNVKRITHFLRDKRFDVKLFKRFGQGGYDYSELGAITSLLNIVIDLGRTTPTFSDKESERSFNADVDALADRIKKIFSSIEDTGASHLRRTEAKQSLEALHYRIVYSVRSKPPAKKSLFGSSGLDDWDGIGNSGSLMNKFLSVQKAAKEPT